MSGSGFGKKMDKGAVDKVLEYLFRKPSQPKDGDKTESQFLDTSTDIANKEFYNTLMYYRLLEEQYQCKAAGAVANIMERLAISAGRMGRLEAVNILKQELPKKEILLRGTTEELKDLEET